MATIPTLPYPLFTFLFLAVRRADLRALPHREAVTAANEHHARRLLVRDYVLVFAGRLPVAEVHHG
ncbi:host cell division inhibitor Icd-like protein [Pectobacterium aroidearum]|uniref:host cell division inhibitor Icd-like protein n=1 Tax=Pectobacterium aroidearum TaxID=1201031 RepID=UPI003315731D